MSTLLVNGTIVDGTGAPPRAGDVLITGGRIAAVGRMERPADADVVDCAGLTVAPGFVDVHSHSDLQTIPGRREKLLQGVTTEVVGNCGFSPFPAPDGRAHMHEFANGILCGEGDWGWKSARAYIEAAARSPLATVAPLVGHGTLRVVVAGFQNGPLTEKQVDAMEQLLDESLAHGAAGFSTGLMYAPGSTAPAWELERLCSVVAKRGKIYATHMRTYFGGVADAVEEQLRLARLTGCRLQISHLQVAGARNWPVQPKAVEAIERARAGGIDVAFDCYPYTAGSTVLTQLLPDWALEGGADALVKRLADAPVRARMAAEIEATMAWRWKDIYISAVGSMPKHSAVGKNLEQLGEAGKKKPVDVAFDLLSENHAKVNMLTFNQSDENLRRNLAHPLSHIGSDGFYVHGRPHPRLHGTFPKFLGTFCRDEKLMPLERAVYKITGATARRFDIKERGELKTGYWADITVFDAKTVASPATYEEPERAPIGIRMVYRNGKRIL